MTHEFKQLLEVAYQWQSKGIRSVLATVVDLEGSSYRRPGVRMLISETGDMHGAVSGGCVEKEVLIQSKSVFKTGIAKVMTYDGRFRLGCEGILYVLLEPLQISETIFNRVQDCFRKRKAFTSTSYFEPEFIESNTFGTQLEIDGNAFSLHPSFSFQQSDKLQLFKQDFQPIFQIYIFGAEHDAVQLCDLASKIGWDVHIIAPPDEQKTIDYFKGATSLSAPLMDAIDVWGIGENTAVVLMSHSFSKDVQYLIALKDTNPTYLGLLGPSSRRERLISEILNFVPDISYEFIEKIHGPTGLNIGAETPSEIALSILAEILSVIRDAEPMPLREKSGKIHD
ncbi:MAG: XdhC family protein [Aquaticitalea sp.]